MIKAVSRVKSGLVDSSINACLKLV